MLRSPLFFLLNGFVLACRNDFIIPSCMESYIVDFGSPKESNFSMDCPHCSSPISLKETVQEEEIWENSSRYF